LYENYFIENVGIAVSFWTPWQLDLETCRVMVIMEFMPLFPRLLWSRTYSCFNGNSLPSS